jgi:hypothetical protein
MIIDRCPSFILERFAHCYILALLFQNTAILTDSSIEAFAIIQRSWKPRNFVIHPERKSPMPTLFIL